MKISIVIPVYNEADSLNDCLRSIADQKLKPHEVIVVDNNSSDGSDVIASSFDFVTLVKEPKQGVVHARNTGFNLSTGDIIARIDADSVLPKTWTGQIVKEFKGSSLSAISGMALYSDIALDKWANAIDLYFRRSLEQRLDRNMYLWGANMAVTKEAWERVKSHVCAKKDMHEDFDLAIHLEDLGDKVMFSENLVASVSARRINSDFISYMKYVWKSPSTYMQHDKKVLWAMMPAVITSAVLYLPGRILYKGFDQDRKGFSFTKLVQPSTELKRVDPTANVI
jgi:glycosyltransferase involved in cell wall biosynthesis